MRRLGDLQIHSSLSTAAVKTIDNEVAIVIAAADRMARGYGLEWSDYDRLHSAHQILIRFLAALRGREVTT